MIERPQSEASKRAARSKANKAKDLAKVKAADFIVLEDFYESLLLQSKDRKRSRKSKSNQASSRKRRSN